MIDAIHSWWGRRRVRLIGTDEHPRVGALARPGRAVLGPLIRASFGVDVVGRQHLPASGPAILAPNHRSFFDTPLLMVTATRPVTFLGKAEYMDSAWTKFAFPAFGMVPIKRSHKKASVMALETAAELLADGQFVGIYPEGTRSRDGDLHRGRSGVAQLALLTGAPIVPVGLIGTERAQPIGARFPLPFRGRVRVEFGEPIFPQNYRFGGSRKRRQHITADVMYAIASMTDQQTADDFAAHDNPLMAGGTESVYLISHHGARGLSWRHAVERAVHWGSQRHDDGRVGEIERLRCRLDGDGEITFEAHIAMSSKFATGPTGSPSQNGVNDE